MALHPPTRHLWVLLTTSLKTDTVWHLELHRDGHNSGPGDCHSQGRDSSTPPPALWWGQQDRQQWLPHSSVPPCWYQALTALEVPAKPSAQHLCLSPQLSFTLLLHQKPIIKPLARGQSDNTAQRCSAGRKGLQGPPFPTQHPTSIMDACQAGSASPLHYP